MHEPAMALDGLLLSPQKEVVRSFYKDMWDHADKSLIPKIFHEGFTFRGSLGSELVGYDQLAGYVDWVTAALGHYTADILAMMNKVIASAEKCTSTVFSGRSCSALHGFHANADMRPVL